MTRSLEKMLSCLFSTIKVEKNEHRSTQRFSIPLIEKQRLKQTCTGSTHTQPERQREYECSPVKVGSPFVKPSRSQEDFLKWLWRQFRSKDLTSLSARQIRGRVITLKPLHTRWQWSPQLLCKCNVTLADKQIMKKWRGWGRRGPKRKKMTSQLVEIRGGEIVYLMNSGDGQCQRNDD